MLRAVCVHPRPLLRRGQQPVAGEETMQGVCTLQGARSSCSASWRESARRRSEGSNEQYSGASQPLISESVRHVAQQLP